jgi:hypothetical protein
MKRSFTLPTYKLLGYTGREVIGKVRLSIWSIAALSRSETSFAVIHDLSNIGRATADANPDVHPHVELSIVD